MIGIFRSATRTLVVLCLTVLLSGCSWTGLNSVSLPFTKGGGDDRIEITVQLRNATNLVPNAEVMYDEVAVGSVRKIELDDEWVANLTIGIEADAGVPADVTARVAQKSLLGAEYLALADAGNRTGEPAPRLLATGDVIGLDRTGRYPETEEVLAAGSMLLNGGGLPQIRSIAHELNAALDGRTDDVKSFLQTVRRFTGRLDKQRDNIASTLSQLGRLSRVVVKERRRISHLAEELPDGIRLLAKERKQLVLALRAVAKFGEVARTVVGSNKRDLEANLNNLRPVTRELARHGAAISKSFDALGYPFPVRSASRALGGDYLNLVTEIEVSAQNLSKHWLGGTPLDGLFNAAVPGSPVGPAGEASDPLRDLVGLLSDGSLEGR